MTEQLKTAIETILKATATSDSWTSSRQDCNLLIAVCQKDPSAQHMKKDRPLVVTECILAAGVLLYNNVFRNIVHEYYL